MKIRIAKHRSPLAASLTLALCGPLWLAPGAAQASSLANYGAGSASTSAVASAAQAMGEGSAVLGLEGSDGDKASALTAALRSELGKRGQTQSQDMTLEELKLTMGCDDGDLACIAEGGKSLEVGELIYGKLNGSEGEYTLTLTVLDVGKARVANALTTTLTDADLADAAIGATATDLVVRLLGPADGATAIPAGDGSGDPVESDDPTQEGPEPEVDEPRKKKKGGLVFGMEKPPAKWKVIGLGVSGGLMLASAGTAIGTTLVTRTPDGKLYKDLIAAAEDSLTDSNARNDIAPDTEGDLCELARQEPSDQPGTVTNASMTEICNKADALTTTATAAWIGTGVFAASTAVFAVLLFTHKADGEDTAGFRGKLRKHQVSLGGAPRRNGGFSLGASLRF